MKHILLISVILSSFSLLWANESLIVTAPTDTESTKETIISLLSKRDETVSLDDKKSTILAIEYQRTAMFVAFYRLVNLSLKENIDNDAVKAEANSIQELFKNSKTIQFFRTVSKQLQSKHGDKQEKSLSELGREFKGNKDVGGYMLKIRFGAIKGKTESDLCKVSVVFWRDVYQDLIIALDIFSTVGVPDSKVLRLEVNKKLTSSSHSKRMLCDAKNKKTTVLHNFEQFSGKGNPKNFGILLRQFSNDFDSVVGSKEQ